MDYRTRIWEKYATLGQARSAPISVAEADHWGAPYDVYLQGWKPTEKNAAIVDVGCGYGRLLRFFAKRGYTNVLGVDISPEQVELAKKIHPNVVQGATSEFLEAHPAAFDLVVAMDVIEHFKKEEVLRFLDAAHGALRPSGRLIVQTLNCDTPWGLVIRYGDFTHETAYNVKSMQWIMRLCGFERFEAREQGPVPHGAASALRWAFWQLLRLQTYLYNLAETGSPGSGVFTRNFVSTGVRR